MGSMIAPHLFMASSTGSPLETKYFMARIPARHSSCPVVRMALLSAWMDLHKKSQHQYVHSDRDGHGSGITCIALCNFIPADISGIVPEHGQSAPMFYFEAAAAIITLVLLGQGAWSCGLEA